MAPTARVNDARRVWLAEVADALADACGLDRATALEIMTEVFEQASSTDGPFSVGTAAELRLAARLCAEISARDESA